MKLWNSRLKLFLLSFVVCFQTLGLDWALAKKSRRLKAGSSQSDGRYPGLPHNPDFLNSCSKTKPTIYNPNSSSKMEGGKSTRFGKKELVNSVEDAARNGRPVTVAMDSTGIFAEKCNNKDSKTGNSVARCLVLVTVDGFDRLYPAYGEKFPNLPSNSFLAMVEDTGGAFKGKGTGNIDIPFRNAALAINSTLKGAAFTVLKGPKYGAQNWKANRNRDLTHVNPLVESAGIDTSCLDAPRNRGGAPRGRSGVPSLAANPFVSSGNQ